MKLLYHHDLFFWNGSLHFPDFVHITPELIGVLFVEAGMHHRTRDLLKYIKL
jgi:hypothetical protein